MQPGRNRFASSNTHTHAHTQASGLSPRTQTDTDNTLGHKMLRVMEEVAVQRGHEPCARPPASVTSFSLLHHAHNWIFDRQEAKRGGWERWKRKWRSERELKSSLFIEAESVSIHFGLFPAENSLGRISNAKTTRRSEARIRESTLSPKPY